MNQIDFNPQGSHDMEVMLPAGPQDIAFIQVLGTIDAWDFVVVPFDVREKEHCLQQDYWIGSSRDGQTWALAETPYKFDEESEEEVAGRYDLASSAVAVLRHPPKRNQDAIAGILLRIYLASKARGPLSPRTLNKLMKATPFPTYRTVESYLPGAPQGWLHLPAELIVDIALSEGACVWGCTFNEYSRDSLDAVLRVVCGPRHDGLMIRYTLEAREVVPLLGWEVDWPLARRGKAEPTQRGKVQGALPWGSEADLSLLSVYQSPKRRGGMSPSPPYFGEPVVRLRVGGRSREAAIANWYTCAKALRRLKKNFPVNAPFRESQEN